MRDFVAAWDKVMNLDRFDSDPVTSWADNREHRDFDQVPAVF